MKSFTRFSKASGSDRARINQIITGSGRYSPKQIAKRQARAARRKGGDHAI